MMILKIILAEGLSHKALSNACHPAARASLEHLAGMKARSDFSSMEYAIP